MTALYGDTAIIQSALHRDTAFIQTALYGDTAFIQTALYGDTVFIQTALLGNPCCPARTMCIYYLYSDLADMCKPLLTL